MPSVVELVNERFGELTEIQKLAMPKVLAGEKVLILAPTGFGKTESALLPILEKIKNQKDNKTPDTEHKTQTGIQALYITPLRSLSRDLQKRFEWWCDRLGITHDVRTGDTPQAKRSKHRSTPPQILLTTVESLHALLMGKIMRRHLTQVMFVIVDEVHDILDNKRGAQLSMGLERLNEIAQFQRIGISATVANESEAAKLLFGDRPHSIAEVQKQRKMEVVVEYLGSPEKRAERITDLSKKHRTLIFVNTRSTAEELSASLKESDAPIDVHHGSLDKEVRMAAEDRFKSGALRSILSTSSLELGIDIGDVDLVVQYGSPHQVFRLIQRIGRSGHTPTAVPKGIVLSPDFDDYLEAEVIRALADNGWMEDKRVETGALDVIAHQVVGLLLDFGRTELSKIHEVLSRSYAYGITYEQLRKIVLQLHSEEIVHYTESGATVLLRTAGRAREYYYQNLSTIPKQKRFAMRDITSNKRIASLDEEFVVDLEIGSSFLSKGQPWIVIDITDKEVLAEPGFRNDIAVPAWKGEDIPVSYIVAQQVGSLRRAHKEKAEIIPDDKTVVLEIADEVVVLHTCFGTKVNEGIAKMFSYNLSKIIMESVRAVADPYRIMLKLPYPVGEEHLLNAFRNMKEVQALLEDSIKNSYLVRFKFLHVGIQFGLLSEDAVVGNRFIELMRYSPVYEETIRSVFFRYFDVARTREVLQQIAKGERKLLVDKREKLSYYSKLGIDKISSGEAIGSFEPREVMITALKAQILSKTMQLQCLSCNATRFMHLAGAEDFPKCHKCGEAGYAIVKEKMNDEEKAMSAALIRAYGKKALIALSAYGIGVHTADRILHRLHKNEKSFYLDLIEAQKNFIKNKRFWRP